VVEYAQEVAQQMIVGFGQLIDNPAGDIKNKSFHPFSYKTTTDVVIILYSSITSIKHTHVLILKSFVGRLEQSRADLHFGNRLVHSKGSGNERSMSLNKAAVTSTGTFSRQTSSQMSIFSRSSRTKRAFADFLNIPWVNGPLEKIWCNMPCKTF